MPQNTDVVILAGGKGMRLRPLTTVFPKPLVPLGDRPVLDILLTRLKRMGFRKVTLCTGYLEELLRAVVGGGSKYGLRIRYSQEDRPLGTAGPLGGIRGLSRTFLVMNGDLLTTLDFRKMLAFHRAREAAATIALYRRDVRIDFGVVRGTEDGDFQEYREKPEYHFEVSMGVYVMERDVLAHLPRGRRTDMPDLIQRVHASGKRVCCYRQKCYWLDIGRMDDYALAQEQFERNRRMFLEVAR
jgi:NDP-mannose synthase